MEPERKDVEAWKNNPWQKLPTWGKWVIGVLGVFILLGIGAAIGGREEDNLKSELASAKTEVNEAENAQQEAEREAEEIKGREAEIVGRAKATAKEIVGKARSESSTLSSKLNEQRGELESVEGELSETESYLTGAEEEKAKSSIGDGTWQSEVDYIPGTYEAEGGGSCYWALLSEPAGSGVEGIIENGGFNKHQILTIDSPYFETRGCGTWHRTG
jgi:hypothetical protein